MANTKSALKRSRQTVARTARNRSIMSRLKSQVRKTRALLDANDKEKAPEAVAQLSAFLDKAAKSGVIHQNSADRRKSIYNKALVTVNNSTEAPKPVPAPKKRKKASTAKS